MKHCTRLKCENNHAHVRGMTLVELLVAIAIILILLPVLYTSIESLYDQHASTFARSVALTKASDTMRGIILDVRGSVYGEDGALPLVSIATSSMTFYTDTDFDGKVERVRYTLTGSTLTKGVIDPTATSSYPIANEIVYTLSTHVSNNASGAPLFRYWTATGTEVTVATGILDVRRVSVRLELEHRLRGVDGEVALESSASIRNLKNAY